MRKLLFMITIVIFASECRIYQGVERRQNDDFAITKVKKIRTAQVEFAKRNLRYADLKELCQENLVSNELCDGAKQGYKFSVGAGEKDYSAQAIPQNYGTEEGEGNFTLYVDESGIIRSATKEGINLPVWKVVEATSMPIKEQ